MKQPDIREVAAALITLLGGGLILVLLLRYAVGILLPFLIGLAIARIVTPPADRLSGFTRIPPRVWRLILMLILFLIPAAVLRVLAGCAVREVKQLIADLTADHNPTEPEWWLSRLPDGVRTLLSSLPFAGGDEGGVFSRMASGAAASLLSQLPALIAGFARAVPGLLVGLIVTVISGTYFAWDPRPPLRAVAVLLPRRVLLRLHPIRSGFFRTALRYLRANLMLSGVTFLVLAVWLAVIGVRYACLAACLIALVDFLPVLGAGTVLVPWGVLCCLGGDPQRGVSLLILSGAVFLIRRFAEPQILAGNLGVHPLCALFFLWAGMKFGGLGGVLLSPLAACLTSALWRAVKRIRTCGGAESPVPGGGR